MVLVAMDKIENDINTYKHTQVTRVVANLCIFYFILFLFRWFVYSLTRCSLPVSALPWRWVLFNVMTMYVKSTFFAIKNKSIVNCCKFYDCDQKVELHQLYSFIQNIFQCQYTATETEWKFHVGSFCFLCRSVLPGHNFIAHGNEYIGDE